MLPALKAWGRTQVLRLEGRRRHRRVAVKDAGAPAETAALLKATRLRFKDVAKLTSLSNQNVSIQTGNAKQLGP